MASRRLGVIVLEGVDNADVSQLKRLALEQAGLELSESDDDESAGPLLVLFKSDRAASVLHLLRSDFAAEGRVILACRGASDLDDQLVCKLLKLGAVDVLDLAPEPLAHQLSSLNARCDLWSSVDEIVNSPLVTGSLVGRSPAWLRSIRRLVEVAITSSQPVLLMAGTGTGKEAAARLIHELDANCRTNFVAVNCGSIVETLSGSELFGHRKGAFTGAHQDREGAVALANGGTLFLDEVGELKPTLQVEFLRVLQEGTFKPVGDDRFRKSEFRLVAATNRDMDQMVRDGRFRSDLFYRIAASICHLPPVRERLEDVPLLVDHFLRAKLGAAELPRVEPRLTRLLSRLPYSGNVRELRSIVEGLAAAYDGTGTVRLAHLPPSVLAELTAAETSPWDSAVVTAAVTAALDQGLGYAEIMKSLSDLVVRAALNQASGRTLEAARRLGVSRRMIESRRASWRGETPARTTGIA